MRAMTQQEVLARLYANAQATEARLARLEAVSVELKLSNDRLLREVAQAKADLRAALEARPTYTPTAIPVPPDYHQQTFAPARMQRASPARPGQYAPGAVPAASMAVIDAEPIESPDDEAF